MRVAVALAAAVLTLAGCGAEAPGRAVDKGTESGVDELASHGGRPCPDFLADPDDEHGFGTDDPAESAPALAEQDRAWVCVYAADEDPDHPLANGTYYRWQRAGAVQELDPDATAKVLSAAGTLVPREPRQWCTADLGPRVVFVLARDGDLTGLVVDRYGCGDVRMTDEPYTNPPGLADQVGAVSVALSSTELIALAVEYS